MKLLRTKMEEVLALFGEEGVAMLEQYDIHVCMATRGMFPAVEAYGEVGGVVLQINPETLEILPKHGRELALIIYPDAMVNESKQIPEDARERFRRSYLVHELTHVQQVLDGRLAIVEAGHMIWEGQHFNVTLQGYVEFPWEREAYLAQFKYIFEGDEELAERGYKQIIATAA